MNAPSRIRVSLLALLSLLLVGSGCATTTEPGTTASPATGSAPAAGSAPTLEILNARAPLPGVVSGGQPTEAELRTAAERGFKTVVNLRTDGETGVAGERELVEGLGMRYVHIPVAGADGLTTENARAMAEALKGAADAPVVLHCGSGNRVGALLAIKAHELEGVPAEEALALGIKGGLTGLEPVVRGRLGL